jgi:cytochrome P450
MLDVYSKEYQQNPYPILTALQAQTRFYYREIEDDWLVLHHHDVKQLLHDHRRLKSSHPLTNMSISHGQSELTGIEALLQETQLFWKLSVPNLDAPIHTRVRRSLQYPFDQNYLYGVADFVTNRADIMLEEISTNNNTHFDLVQSYTKPLLNQMVAHLFGVPMYFSQKMGENALNLSLMHNIRPNAEWIRLSKQSLLQFYTYFKSALPQMFESGTPFVQGFIKSYEQNKLTMDELIAQLVLFYMVGSTTIQDLVNSAVYHLLQNQELRDEVVAQPILIPNLITETLRYETPTHYVARRPHEPLELFDEKVKPGQRILLMIAAAHHDPDVFEQPQVFNIHRNTTNQLLSFGGGIHKCIGDHVAPIVAKIVVEKLLAHFPHITLNQTQEPQWHKQFLLRRLETLPVIV